MFRTLSRFNKLKTGQISNETKVGRLASMFHHQVLHKKESFDFSAFGETLIGRTTKALSIAQDYSREASGQAPPGKIMIIPYMFDTPMKRRGEIPSVRFIIHANDIAGDEPWYTDVVKEIKIASTSVPESVGKNLHDLYLKQVNRFELRCVGEVQCAKAVLSMALFNENVRAHKLTAWFSNKLVSDGYRSEKRMIRAILFNVSIIESAHETHSPS